MRIKFYRWTACFIGVLMLTPVVSASEYQNDAGNPSQDSPQIASDQAPFTSLNNSQDRIKDASQSLPSSTDFLMQDTTLNSTLAEPKENKNCETRRAETRQSITCKIQHSDGSYTQTFSYEMTEPGEEKKQVIITQFDSSGMLIVQKTIRHKKSLSIDGRLEAEHFDLVTRPREGKILREFLIRIYDTRSEQPEKLIWTKYQQIGTEMMAEISDHTVLEYEANGSRVKGRAEKWENGQVVDTTLYLDKTGNPGLQVNLDSWSRWESQINGMMQQASLI